MYNKRGVFFINRGYKYVSKKSHFKTDNDYKFKQEIKKIVVDKLCIGLITIILTVIVSMQANKYIENLKASLADRNFLLQKRYEAVQAISTAYGNLYFIFDKCSAKNFLKEDDGSCKSEFNDKYKIYETEIRRWDTLLSKEFRKNLIYHGHILEAMTVNGPYGKYKYRTFMNAMNENFKGISNKELGSDIVFATDYPNFLYVWTQTEAENSNATFFFLANYQAYSTAQCKHKDRE